MILIAIPECLQGTTCLAPLHGILTAHAPPIIMAPILQRRNLKLREGRPLPRDPQLPRQMKPRLGASTHQASLASGFHLGCFRVSSVSANKPLLPCEHSTQAAPPLARPLRTALPSAQDQPGVSRLWQIAAKSSCASGFSHTGAQRSP